MAKNEPFVAPHNCFRLLSEWPWPHASQRPDRLPGVGDLVFLRLRTGFGQDQRIWSDLTQGYSIHPSQLDLERHPPLTWRDFPALLKAYTHGFGVLPNFEFVRDLQRGLDEIAAWGGAGCMPNLGHIIVPGLDRDLHTRWARILIGYTQGGAFDGTGILVYYKGLGCKSDLPQIARFAICRHTKRTTSSHYQQMHGWHPGSCTRCGLNMTVDSSD